ERKPDKLVTIQASRECGFATCPSQCGTIARARPGDPLVKSPLPATVRSTAPSQWLCQEQKTRSWDRNGCRSSAESPPEPTSVEAAFPTPPKPPQQSRRAS